MILYGFILAVCCIPGWNAYAIPTGWLFLGATLPFILRERLATWNWFFLYACLGLLWTPIWQQGIYDLWKLAILCGAFALGRSRIDSKRVYVGMAFGFAISTVIAAGQMMGWQTIPQPPEYSDPAGLFVNPNVFGEIAALLTIALLASNLHWLAILTAPAILMSHSRTALLACGITGSIWLWRRYSLVGPIVILFAALIGTSLTFDKQLDRIPYRFAIWQNTIDGFTFAGRGPGSFIVTYPEFATRTDTMVSREEDAHNDFLQLAYQYGLGALLLVPLIAVGLLGPLGPERYLFVAFAIVAFFNFPLQIPCEGFLGCFALGRLWRDRPLVWRDWVLCRWFEQRRLGFP